MYCNMFQVFFMEDILYSSVFSLTKKVLCSCSGCVIQALYKSIHFLSLIVCPLASPDLSMYGC